MTENAATSWFAARGEPGVADFWATYDRECESICEEAIRGLASHAEFGPALARVSIEVAHAHVRRLMCGWHVGSARDSVSLDVGIAACSAFFAGAGVRMTGLLEACAALGNGLMPHLFTAYAADPARLLAALLVLQRHTAHVTSVVAEAFGAAQDRALGLARLETRQALDRFERLSESGVLGVLVCDFAGNIKEANDGFLTTFGYSRQDLLSGEVRWASMTPKEWQHLDDDAIQQLRESGKTRPWEKEYFHKDGSRVPVLVGVALLNETETIAFVLDISERKRHDQIRLRSLELENQNRRIQEANRLKSEFLANMSHELRTPLNSIIGFAELLHDKEIEPNSPMHTEFLGDILQSGRHLQQLINDVLDLAKVEAGKIELRPEPVEVDRLIREVSAVLRTIAAQKRIRIEAEVHPEVKHATLDPGRFKQVLYNYLSNALKFTPEGGNVTVRATPEAPAMLRISVEDTGIGIAPADLGRLFVEFQQLEAGATKKHAGTGLGLALTKRLAEAQGGSVGVKSVLGKGSQFFAVLPLHALAELPEPPGTPQEPLPGVTTVLVVDDDARDRALLVQTLTRGGYGVEAAASGLQAITCCARRVFDAITLDLLLPDMTGLDVLHKIRLEGKNRKTPVIVVSVVAEQGVLAGFSVQDYLPKPVDGRDLLSALEHAAVLPEKGGTILVVDDDPSARRLMGATLEKLGYRIASVETGEEALSFVAQERPLAVILDLMMPGVDGFEFLMRFRRSTENRSIPVIVWTMKDLTLDDRRHLQDLAQRIVGKDDWTPSSFLEELRELISAERAIPTGALI